MILRVPKEHSVYVYQILESYEGLANYSTLACKKEQAYRDIAVITTKDLAADLHFVLENLKKEIPFQILNIDPKAEA